MQFKIVFLLDILFTVEIFGAKIIMVKLRLTLDYIYHFVHFVNFHAGGENVRSQKAIEKLGAKNCGELNVAYFGEEARANILYRICKEDWL